MERLSSGQPLDGLSLGVIDNRLDLRGLAVPEIEVGAQRMGEFQLNVGSGMLEINGGHLQRLDLSGARLSHMRFFDSTIQDCRFDGAACLDWRIWTTQISKTTFIGADLRSAMLGTWHHTLGEWKPDREVSYQYVDFSGANMRGVGAGEVSFTDCDFAGAALVGVDFNGATFVRCHFAGLLERVTFHQRGFQAPPQRPPNRMEDVDLRDTRLREVYFRGLDLDRVELPNDDEHLVVRQYRCVLKRMLEDLPQDDSDGGLLRARFEGLLEWAGPEQFQGVLARADYARPGRNVNALFARLREVEAECVAQEH